MKYAHILAEISRQLWAVTPEAMKGILSALEGELELSQRSIFHAAEIEAIGSLLGEPIAGSKISSVRGDLGIIQIDGPIIPRASSFSQISGIVSIDQLTADFKVLEADETISKIVFVVDSPGGSVTGVSEFAQLVEKSEKPTAAYVYGFAASAAYWIASATDSITVSDTGLVGSIGTVLTVRRKSESDPLEIVSAQSPNKRPDPETDEGARELQRIVDGLASVFVNAVARNRNTTAENVVEKFGAGGLVLPPDALAAGMIDGVETLAFFLEAEAEASPLEDALELAAENGAAEAEASGDPADIENIIDNYARKTDKDNYKPAGAGSSEGAKPMPNLKAFIAENPEAAAELDKLTADAIAEGAEIAEARFAKRLELASKIMTSDYPETIKGIAIDVIKGEKEAGQLETAIAVFDALKSKEDVDAAVADSAATEATPAQQDQRSTDGVIRTEADIEAAAEEMKTR